MAVIACSTVFNWSILNARINVAHCRVSNYHCMKMSVSQMAHGAEKHVKAQKHR